MAVGVARNDDPAAVGCDPAAQGFPVCTAGVTFGGRGYDAVMGWVQLVGEVTPDGQRRFAVDPLQIYEHLDTPFGWFGIAPTLFDGPSRRNRDRDLDWLAHSFLCVSPAAVMAREVVAVAGFSWDFTMVDGAIDLVEPAPLGADDWAVHLDLLHDTFAGWRFFPSGLQP